MKILLAIDGSPYSDQAVAQVACRPWPKGSEVKVLTAFELSLLPTPEAWALPATFLDEMEQAGRRYAREIGDRAVGLLESRLDKGVAVSKEALPGSPRSVILDEAKNWGADLIVVGSHGYCAWERFLLGSVSQSVVSHADCSVEVVRSTNGEMAPDTELEEEV